MADLADDENGQLQIEVKRHGVEKPNFELAITAHGLAIYETKSRIAFTLTKKGEDKNSIHTEQMVNLVCPRWMLDRVRDSIDPAQ